MMKSMVNINKAGKALLMAAAIILTVMAGGCERSRKQVSMGLLEQGRELVKNLDGSEGIVGQIDSLTAENDIPADTAVAGVCAGVARQLRLARRYKELWAWVNDAGERLEHIRIHDREVQDQLMNMNLEVAAGYYDLRLYDRYLQLLIKLESIADRYGFHDHLAEIHIDMAAAYSEKDRYDRALSVLQNVIADKDKITDRELVEVAYYNIAWAWRGKGNYDKAVEYGMLALHHVPEGNTLLEMRTRVGIATFYNRMNEYSLALRQLELVKAYYERHGLKDLLGEALPKLALSQWKLGHISQAQNTFDEAMEIRDEGSVMSKMALLNQYSIFCDSMGMHDRQIALQKELIAEYEKTIKGNSNEMLTQLYNDELSKSDKNLRDYQRSRVELWVSVAMLTLIATGIVWWMSRRNRRVMAERDDIARERDDYHEHLITAEIDQMKYTSFAQSIAKELQELQKTVTSEPTKVVLQQLRKITSRAMRLESEANNELTTLAHVDFFQRLLERYPDLTNNDLRICALLRRGMTSKEIAEILCRESQTIDIARTRIRRKCGLQPDEDLNTFMMMV